jgi:flagellar basal body-associated protein FliL
MADDPKTAEAAPVKGDKSKLILIVVIGFLSMLLVGGGVAGFFLLRGQGDSADTEAVAEETEEAVAADKDEEKKPAKADKKDKGKKAKDAAPKGPALYVSLEPPFVVNFAPGQPARFLQITAQLMTRDAATAQLLKDNDPLVRNDLLMLFATQTYEGISAAEGKETLRNAALNAVRNVVKTEGGSPDNVEAVYFTSIVMQ